MKKILLVSFVSLSLLFLTDCKKKKKSETAADPCANTTCLNGGTCVDGSCSCPTGYSGADCGTQRTPAKITITGIKVTKFPGTKSNGSAWDDIAISSSAADPDIYVNFKKDGGSSPLLSSGTVSDVKNTTSYILPNVTPTEITDLVVKYRLELMDEDIGGDQTMGNITFDLYTSSNRFPTTLVVDNGTVGFELTLQYTY